VVSAPDGHLTVSAVLPALNASGTLESAVDAVLAQTYAGPIDLTIAVGPSSDETAALAARLAADRPQVAVVENPTGTTPNGLNAAIQASSGEVVVRVDAHSVLPPNYIERAVATLRETGAANVGGIQRAVGTSAFQQAVAAALMSPFGQGGASFRSDGGEGRPTDTVYLGVFDRAALEAVGGFNPTYIRNQDYELNWRLRKAGHTVWLDPQISVDYSPRSTVSSLASQYWQYGRWKARMLGEYPDSTRLRQLVAPVLVVALLISIVLLALGSRLGLVVPVAYAVAVAIAAFFAAERSIGGAWARLLAVFPTMHLSWGSGFLASVPAALRGRFQSR